VESVTDIVRFRLIETLGRPDLYLAEVEGAGGPPVVLRVVTISGRFPEVRARVQQQAELLARVGHPGVIFVWDLVQHAQRCVAVSDYVPGADLEHVLAALELGGERLPVRAALAIGGGILAAIAGAQPFVHGALRPSSVHLTVRGGVRVADYNLPPSEMTESLTLREQYLSPERLLGHPPAVEGDVYAAACIVAELLTGRRVAGQLVAELQRKGVEELLSELHQRYEGQPAMREALGVLARALEVPKAARPSPEELQGALDRAAASLSGETLPTFAGRFLPELDAILGRMSTPLSGVLGDAEPTPRERRPPASVFVATAVISATCGAIGAYALLVP
jgi:serine/threonine protein kinase